MLDSSANWLKEQMLALVYHTPHLYVRGLKENAFVSLRPNEEICFTDAQKDKTGNKHDGIEFMPTVFQLVNYFYP